MNEKIVKIVSNITEKKRINNVIRSVEFTLDYVASLGHSASKSNSSGFDFSYAKKYYCILCTDQKNLQSNSIRV